MDNKSPVLAKERDSPFENSINGIELLSQVVDQMRFIPVHFPTNNFVSMEPR